jgi:hypothetical protein
MLNAFRPCAAVALILLLSPAAFAGFVNGVERFEGSQLDLQTWEPFISDLSPVPAAIIQDNDLVIDATPSGSLASYTTRERLVGVGEGFRVDVTHLRPNGGSIHLRSPGTLDNGIWMFLNPTTSDVIGARPNGNGTSLVRPGGRPDDFLTQDIGETLTYEVIRLSAARARWSAYDADGVLVGSLTGDIGEPISEALSISLQANNGSARFDNVTLVPIPLPPAAVPGLAVLAGVIGGTVLRRWRSRTAR